MMIGSWTHLERINRFRFLVRCIILTASFLFTSFVCKAQPNGEELFDDLCADCHSIGDGIYRGPDLLGMEKRFSHEWLVKFIQSSKTMIAEGDPKALAVFEKYKKKKMADTDAAIEEINAIITYIASFSKSTASTGIADVKSPDAAPEKSEIPFESYITAENINVVRAEIPDERINALEEKLDQLLKYHKRNATSEITEEDIEKGYDLFVGNILFKNGAPACVSCHNIRVVDTLNWNPSALDIIERYSGKKGEDIEQVMAKPVSRKMKEILEEHQLTEREMYTINTYLQTLEETGLEYSNEFPFRKIVFIIIGMLILLSLVDLTVTKKIKAKYIPVLIILICGIVVTQILVKEAQNLGLSQGYEPDQPIKFSHKIHAGENGIDCLYCHSTPEYSKISGIPYDDVCINCHNKIKSGTKSGTFEIAKIHSSIKNSEPIEWIKVHNLPDHVFYSHAQHVGAGKLECKICHGEVEKMDRVRQVSSLSMKWCIDCHRKQEVQFTDNEYYKHYTQLHEDLKSGKIDKVTVDDIGGNDCQKCHY